MLEKHMSNKLEEPLKWQFWVLKSCLHSCSSQQFNNVIYSFHCSIKVEVM